MSTIPSHIRAPRGALSDASSLTNVAWVPKTDIQRPEWVLAGHRLGAISRASQWWIGDWLNYGAQTWGEKYVQAAKISGYDVGGLETWLRWRPSSARHDVVTG